MNYTSFSTEELLKIRNNIDSILQDRVYNDALDNVVKEILKQAKYGVYFNDIKYNIKTSFNINEKQLNTAKKKAIELGMYSISDMSDWRGVFYQYDGEL